MVLAPFLFIIVSSIGYLNFRSSAYGRLRLKRLGAGVLTINIVAYGTLHLFAGFLLTLVLSMFALQFELYVVPPWLFSFAAVGTDYQLPPAAICIFIVAVISARWGQYLTKTGRRRAKAADHELARELVDSDMELSFLQALEAEDYAPLGSSKVNHPLLFRAVLRNRKVYIGNLTKCDLTRGNSKSIVIQPIFSGYQNEQTLELEITELYDTHYKKLVNQELKPGEKLSRLEELLTQFTITIPVAEIVTTSMFSIGSYIDFLKDKADE